MTLAAVATGRSVVEMLREARFEDICELFAPALRPMVTAEALGSAWAAQLGRAGPVRTVGEPLIEAAGHGSVVRVPVTCEHGGLVVVIPLGPAGRLRGLQFASAEAARPSPPWEPPPYASPATFTEEEVTVGAGPLAVGGTLSVPHGPGPHVGVVMMGGSGPTDRDATLGPAKPLKDLAWGLASRGVVVLRADKVTFAHPAAAARDGFTVADEYLPAALAAVTLLAGHPAVDARRVVMLGHSLGGTVAPRIAAVQPSVTGVVILAGGTQPLHHAALRQVRYLASLDAAQGAALAPTIDLLTRQAAAVDDPGLALSTPAAGLPFGTPAPYWLDLRGYDPVATAAALGRPVLILQGGRDYQVTVADDLTGWRAGLDGRPGVTITILPADNHLFVPGSGPSTPAEYEVAQHVDPAVITLIADWLGRL